MINDPLVSVIIPVYNRQHLLARAIKSVLNQTYRNLELIVVDDASTDASPNIVKQITDARLKYFRNENNLGPSASRNIGIKLASGMLIAFQDSDDEWYPDKLEKQVKAILNSTLKTGAVYCGMEFIDFSSGRKCGESIKGCDFRKNFTSGNHFLTPANVTVLIRKTVLDEVGYFDERLNASEDTELAIRLSKKYDYIFIPEVLVRVTRNHNQLMGNSKNYIDAREIILAKHGDYLSRKVMFGTCKMIANYYILTRNYSKATKYLRESLKYSINLKTFFLLTLLHFPAIIDFLYTRKFKGKVPLASGLKTQ